jgi:hypothetical protein
VKFIKPFNITESLGISKPSIILADFLSNRVYQDFTDFFPLDKKRINIEDSIKWKTIKDNLSSSDLKIWIGFPIVEFLLKIRFQKDVRFADKKSRYSVGGEFFRFSKSGSDRFSFISGDGDPSIRINMGISIEIAKSFSENDFDDLYTHINSTILHELNHAYEYFKRNHAPDQSLGVASVTLKNPDNSSISDQLFEEWENFTYLLYYSDPVEVNAMSQESLGHLDDANGVPSRIPAWDWAEKMVQFSAKRSIEKLLSLADGDKSKLDLLKDSFNKRLKVVINADKGYKWPAKSVENFKKIEKLNWIQLIKSSEDRIHSSGKRLKRNIIRLFSYDE